jgi:hypothetical protein
MPEPLLDHLALATHDLDTTVAEFTTATGVQPVEGGRHVGRGTRNYLVGFGPTSYLEIIGPDVERPVEPGAMPFGLGELTGSRLVTWAVHPRDLESAVAAAAAQGCDLGAIQSMSRTTPAGETLSWRLTMIDPAPYDGIVPFLIDWGESRHPAASGLPTVELVDFTATHPQPDAVSAVLHALDLDLPVDRGEAALTATVAGPAGSYQLR